MVGGSNTVVEGDTFRMFGTNRVERACDLNEVFDVNSALSWRFSVFFEEIDLDIGLLKGQIEVFNSNYLIITLSREPDTPSNVELTFFEYLLSTESDVRTIDFNLV